MAFKEFQRELTNLFPTKSPITNRNRISFLTNREIEVSSTNRLGRLQDVKYIISLLNSKSVGSFKTYLFHILEYLKAIGNTELYDEYNQYKDPIVKKAFAQSDDNKHNSYSLNMYIPYEEVNKKFNESFKSLINEINNLNIDELTPAILNEVVNYMLLSLYINQPPIRNDFAKCKIISNKKSITDKGNYFLITSKTMYFYLNEYKNKKILGSVRINISKVNQQYLRYYLALIKKIYKHLPEYIFNNYKQTDIVPLTEEPIIKRLMKLSNHLFGKPLSVNAYRHIYEIYLQNDPNYNKLTIAQKNNLHKQSLHSTITAQAYNRI